MSVIQYVKYDWTVVLPYRLLHNRYRGASRSSYALICLVYYSIKSLLILYFYGAFKVYKFILWDIWEWLWRRSKKHNENNDSSKDQDVTIERHDEQEEDEQEQEKDEFDKSIFNEDDDDSFLQESDSDLAKKIFDKFKKLFGNK